MKGWSSYLWSGTIALAEIDVILYIFAHLEGRIEHLLVSLLGLIYVAVYAIAAGREQEQSTIIELINAEMIKIRKLIDETTPVEKIEAVRDAAERQAFTQRLIRDIGLVVVWGVCIFQLFRTL